MDVTVVCPRCGGTRRGERFRVDEHGYTICYCHRCGPTWTRDSVEQRPAPALPTARQRRPRAAAKMAS
jgi:hypothetical protein